MRKRSSKEKPGPEDVNETPFGVLQDAVKAKDQATEGQDGLCSKNPAAVQLGRLGGLKGGKARAVSMSAEERSDIARKAAAARWAKKGDHEEE